MLLDKLPCQIRKLVLWVSEDFPTIIVNDDYEIKHETENCAKNVMQKFSGILQIPNLEFESLEIFLWDEETRDMYFKLLLKYFKSRTDRIYVKTCVFGELKVSQIALILPFYQAGTLEEIHFANNGETDDLEQIVHLKQWKRAKRFVGSGDLEAYSITIQHLFHFVRFEVHIDRFSIEDAVSIRDKLLKSASFENCTLYFPQTDYLEITKIFGPMYTGSIGGTINFKAEKTWSYSLKFGPTFIQITRIESQS